MTYSWDFGDGTRLSTTSPDLQSHTYKNPGLYSVSVTMTDASGKTALSSIVIEVTGDTDSDGDGISDTLDACPNVIGDSTNRGCPVIQTNTYTRNNTLNGNTLNGNQLSENTS
jgi:PKD repeat protein